MLFDPSLFAREFSGVDPQHAYSELIKVFRDPLSGADAFARHAFHQYERIPAAGDELPFPHAISALQLAFAKKLASSNRYLFRIVQSMLCVTGSEPICERYASLLWNAIGDRRGQLRDTTLRGIVVAATWPEGMVNEAVRRLLVAHYEARNPQAAVSAAAAQCATDDDLRQRLRKGVFPLPAETASASAAPWSDVLHVPAETAVAFRGGDDCGTTLGMEHILTRVWGYRMHARQLWPVCSITFRTLSAFLSRAGQSFSLACCPFG